MVNGLFPEIVIEDTESTKFIKKLTKSGFISRNKTYLSNYINSDLSIALSHIKKTYEKYVVDGNWSEEKFELTLKTVIEKRELITPRNMLKYGYEFDDNSSKSEREKEKHENFLAMVEKLL